MIESPRVTLTDMLAVVRVWSMDHEGAPCPETHLCHTLHLDRKTTRALAQGMVKAGLAHWVRRHMDIDLALGRAA